MDNLAAILPLLGIAVLFWLILIRPAQRRQRSLAQLQSRVSVGDRVMLTSGILGTVRGLDDRTVSLEVSEGVTLKVVRAAVGSVETSATPDDDAELVVDEPEEKQ
ncbi:MAG: preprotein translocase subunit YajC [Nocardioides sp.]